MRPGIAAFIASLALGIFLTPLAADARQLVRSARQGSRNYSGFHDAKIDDLIERGLRETDPASRRDIYQELQRYILSQPLPQLTLGWHGGYRYVDK